MAAMRVCASSISGNSTVGEKPLEGRDEHRVGVGRAAGRLIELRQRQRRAQLEAPCLLLGRRIDSLPFVPILFSRKAVRPERFLILLGTRLERLVVRAQFRYIDNLSIGVHSDDAETS
jgi:hypothetical protein